MTDSKALHHNAENDFVIKLDDLQKTLDAASSNLEPLRSQVKKHLQPQDLQQIDNIRTSIGKCSGVVSSAKQNLDSVSEILNLRKSNFELKEIVVRSWPKRALSERLTYISSALFPIGGTPFILTGGEITPASGLAAMVVWAAATALMIGSLAHIYLDDREKWSYFKSEFEVATAKDATNHRSKERPSGFVEDRLN